MTSRNRRGSDGGSARENIGAIFQGLGEIMNRLSDLGGELSRRFAGEGESEGEGESKRPWKGVYGFSIKVGPQGESVKVEPFGNVPRGGRPGAARGRGRPGAATTTRPGAARATEAPIHEIREPLCDTFDEGDSFRIVAEMPGISERDLTLEIDGDILTLSAESGDKHYRKEILLPQRYGRDGMTVVCNNGIVDINLRQKV